MSVGVDVSRTEIFTAWSSGPGAHDSRIYPNGGSDLEDVVTKSEIGNGVGARINLEQVDALSPGKRVITGSASETVVADAANQGVVKI